MFFQREFLRDSDSSNSSSFEEEGGRGTPPPYYQQAEASQPTHLESEFSFPSRPYSGFQTNQPSQSDLSSSGHQFSTNPVSASQSSSRQFSWDPPSGNLESQQIHNSEPHGQAFKPMKRQENEKISMVNEPVRYPEDSEYRPTTASNRPTSASAQMRMKMLEQHRKQLLNKKEAPPMQVTSSAGYRAPGISSMISQSMKPPEDTGLNSIIYSSDIIREQDMKDNKELKGFAAPQFKFEPPTGKKDAERMPGPIKPDRTVFKNQVEELEEVVLDESSAIKNAPSKTLQQMNQQRTQEFFTEEVKSPAKPVAVSAPPPAAYPSPPKYVTQTTNSFFDSSPQPSGPPQTVQQFSTQPISQPIRPPTQTVQLPPPPAPREAYTEPQHSTPQGPTEAVSHQTTYQTPEGPTPIGPGPVVEAPQHPMQANVRRHSDVGIPPENQQPREDQVNARDRSHSQAVPRAPPSNYMDIIRAEMSDMKRFLMKPVPRGIMLQCTIQRNKSGFNRLFPKYSMHLSQDYNFLLAGKKRPKNKTSNYLISMSKDNLSVKSPHYLGKVRSNFLGTKFSIYDTGLNPKRKGANAMNTREELGIVLYVRYI